MNILPGQEFVYITVKGVSKNYDMSVGDAGVIQIVAEVVAEVAPDGFAKLWIKAVGCPGDEEAVMYVNFRELIAFRLTS